MTERRSAPPAAPAVITLIRAAGSGEIRALEETDGSGAHCDRLIAAARRLRAKATRTKVAHGLKGGGNRTRRGDLCSIHLSRAMGTLEGIAQEASSAIQLSFE